MKCIDFILFNRGGGPYVDGQKSGKWIEVHENFLE